MSPEEPKKANPAGVIDFTAFVFSLSTAALQHLGLGGQEGAGEPAKPHLPLAKQTIDILAMLQEKTRGNLTADEEKLLGAILYDLRMRYVEASRGTQT